MSFITVYWFGISDADVEEKLGKLDIESVGSDIDYTAQQKTIEGSVGANNALPGNLVLNEENSDKKAAEDVMAKGIRFSLTTDVGLVEGVEIYDYDKRGMEFFCIFHKIVTLDAQ